ncbi:MAG TPA: hypothetical protein VGI81_17700 [Tepidisphaeraceae bacterium]|jgi:hypothetical protein
MPNKLWIAAAISAALASPVFAQSTRPLSTDGSALSADANLDSIRLRSLQAVLDAREKRQDWHDAAQQAQAPIREDALKQQLMQRLSGLAPRVAKELAAHPQDDALVSVAVYKEPGAEGKQAMIAVTFDGLGTEMGSDYFANVLAGQTKPPQIEGVPEGLVPDEQASSYLVFFRGNRALEAGDIPQAKMRQSVVAAINHQRELAAHQDQVAIERQNAQAEQQAREQEAQQAADRQQANEQAQQQQVIPEYPNGMGGAAPNGYDDGYYYPPIGVPIVIIPNGYANTPQWRARERAREEQLEKIYRSRRESNRTASDNGQPAQPPPEGTPVTPRAKGVTIPPGSQGVRIPPGSQGTPVPHGNQGESGTRQPAANNGIRSNGNGGQGTTERQAPAERQAPVQHQAPAEHQAPAQQAPAQQQAPAGNNSGANSGARK